MSSTIHQVSPCSYCGRIHNYSAEICRDMTLRTGTNTCKILLSDAKRDQEEIARLRAALDAEIDWLENAEHIAPAYHKVRAMDLRRLALVSTAPAASTAHGCTFVRGAMTYSL